MPDRPPLMVFTPLPPERNGIADYAHALLGALAPHYAATAACADWSAHAPPGIAVIDPALAHRHSAPQTRVLHQLGNNPGHGFVLRALRHTPGVVTLHDPALLHLYEMVEDRAAILAGTAHANPHLADRFARHLAHDDLSSTANHALFDLAGEVLARASAVIVHSRFARARLRATHGVAATRHVHVIPHPVLPTTLGPDRAHARTTLGIPPDTFLVLTAGFASPAKQFAAVAEAVATLAAAGGPLQWIHAGPAEGVPSLAQTTVTGWLPEPALTTWLAAADVLVNLRFPSRGESSGTVARALGAGLATIVSDTAAYAELPREAVHHVPVTGTAPALAAALADLARNPDAARALGERGRAFAREHMALPAVARAYADVLEAAKALPAPPRRPARTDPLVTLALTPTLTAAAVARALADIHGSCRLLLTVDSLDTLAEHTLDHPGLLRDLLPPWASVRATRVLDSPGRAGVLLTLDLPWRPRGAPA